MSSRKKSQGKKRKAKQEKEALESHCFACSLTNKGTCKHHVHTTACSLEDIKVCSDMTKNVFMKKGHHALFEVDGLNENQKGVLREMLIASATEMVKRCSFDSYFASYIGGMHVIA